MPNFVFAPLLVLPLISVYIFSEALWSLQEGLLRKKMVRLLRAIYDDFIAKCIFARHNNVSTNRSYRSALDVEGSLTADLRYPVHGISN